MSVLFGHSLTTIAHFAMTYFGLLQVFWNDVFFCWLVKMNFCILCEIETSVLYYMFALSIHLVPTAEVSFVLTWVCESEWVSSFLTSSFLTAHRHIIGILCLLAVKHTQILLQYFIFSNSCWNCVLGWDAVYLCVQLQSRMDRYFTQLIALVDERKTSSRIRFLLLDTIDLRKVLHSKFYTSGVWNYGFLCPVGDSIWAVVTILKKMGNIVELFLYFIYFIRTRTRTCTNTPVL